MRRASIREFRANLANVLEQSEPVVVARHGKAVAVVYPLKDIRRVPPEVRRDLADSAARDFGVGATDEVIDLYKRGVDRTLIRENLERTPAERLRSLEAMQEFRDELRTAADRTR